MLEGNDALDMTMHSDVQILLHNYWQEMSTLNKIIQLNSAL